MGYKTAIYKPGFVNPLKSAFKFLILLGIVSLFADMTYEGARSITGPYLAILGASATTVGIVAGLGEFAGYGIRIIFGLLADCTGRYWTITIIGYFLNLLVYPSLTLAGSWEISAVNSCRTVWKGYSHTCP